MNVAAPVRLALTLALLAATPGCFLWDDSDDDDAPMFSGNPSLAFSSGTVRSLATVPFGPVTPTLANSSGADRYTIDPALPAGLEIDPDTGTISGTPPTPFAPLTFTVSAEPVSFVANPAGGSFESVFTIATAAITIEILPPVAPSSVSYAVNPASYFRFATIVPNVPTVTGLADSFTIVPTLPAGLRIDPTTGVIEGQPTEDSPATDYVVTAANPFGSTTTTINLRVFDDRRATAMLVLHGDGTLQHTQLLNSPFLPDRSHFRALASEALYTVAALDGSYTLTACANGDLVRHRLDPASSLPLAPEVVDTGRFPFAMELDPTGTRLLLLEGTELLSIALQPDGTPGAVESIDLFDFPAALAVRGSRAYLSLPEQGVVAAFTVLPTLQRLPGDVAADGYPARLAVSDTGAFVFALDPLASTVQTFRTQSTATQPLVDVATTGVPANATDLVFSRSHVWVSHAGTGGVSRHLVRSDGTLAVPQFDPVLDPAGSYDALVADLAGNVFALDRTNEEVVELDTLFAEVEQRFRTRNRPTAMALVPGPRRRKQSEWLFAADPAADRIEAFAFAYPGSVSATGVGSVATGAEPASILVGRERDKVYVANRGDGTLDVLDFDPATGVLSRSTSLAVGTAPAELRRDRSDRFLFVLDPGASAIHTLAVDATDGSLSPVALREGPFATATRMLLDPTGQFAYVTCADGTLVHLRIDERTGELAIVETLALGGSLADAAMSGEGRHLYVADTGLGRIRQFATTIPDGRLVSLVPSFVATTSPVTRLLHAGIRSSLLGLAPATAGGVAWAIDEESGVLTEYPDSPFVLSGAPTSFLLEANSTTLFVGYGAPNVPSVQTLSLLVAVIPAPLEETNLPPVAPVLAADERRYAQ